MICLVIYGSTNCNNYYTVVGGTPASYIILFYWTFSCFTELCFTVCYWVVFYCVLLSCVLLYVTELCFIVYYWVVFYCVLLSCVLLCVTELLWYFYQGFDACQTNTLLSHTYNCKNIRYFNQVLRDVPKARREVTLHVKAVSCPHIVQIKDVYENVYSGNKCLLVVMEW